MQNKVLQTLSGGAADILKEEMKYAGKFPPERLRQEKRVVISTYRKLRDAGEIQGDSPGTEDF